MQALDTDAPHKYKMLPTPSAKDRGNSASAGKEDSQHARRESRGDALSKKREDTKEKETQATLKSKIVTLTVDEVRARAARAHAARQMIQNPLCDTGGVALNRRGGPVLRIVRRFVVREETRNLMYWGLWEPSWFSRESFFRDLRE